MTKSLLVKTRGKWWFHGIFYWILWELLSGNDYCNSLLLSMAEEIVDFPIKTADFSIVMLNYQRAVPSFLFGLLGVTMPRI